MVMENSKFLGNLNLIELAKNENGLPVRLEYLEAMREKEKKPNALMSIRACRRNDHTYFLVLIYGDETDRYKQCNVLGYGDVESRMIYIYQSQDKLTRDCLYGFKPSRFDPKKAPGTQEYTAKQVATVTGIEMKKIWFVPGPYDEELKRVKVINGLKNQHEALKVGLCTRVIFPKKTNVGNVGNSIFFKKIREPNGANVRIEYLDFMRKATKKQDALMSIIGSYRSKTTIYVTLIYGDKKDMFQHCTVLGVGDTKTGDLYLFKSKLELSIECIEGLKPTRKVKDIETGAPLIDKTVLAGLYGLDREHIKRTNDREEKKIYEINSTTSHYQAIQNGLRKSI